MSDGRLTYNEMNKWRNEAESENPKIKNRIQRLVDEVIFQRRELEELRKDKKVNSLEEPT